MSGGQKSEDKADENAGWGSTLASWGGGMWNYATQTITNVLGFDDLDIVDPDSNKAEHGHADTADQRQQAFGNFRDYIGMDITSLVTLPVWIMEPYTMLQKAAEIMEYTDLLNRACNTEDEFERMAWVAAWCVSPFGSNERTWKPFNPILGETFEVSRDGYRFIAEQVSHHPPIAAAHAETDTWKYDIVSAPTTKFLGNSVDIYPVGRSRILLRKRDELYSLVPCNCKAHNVIMGRTWVDAYGNLTVVNITTGAKCSLYFQPCGWFGAGRYEISGHISDKNGVKKLALAGKWNGHLDMARCDAEGDPLPDAEQTRLWTCAERPADDKYGFTHFARSLLAGTGVNPLSSDSRRRPDRAALQAGDHSTAGAEKYRLEEEQRAEKREREKRGDSWVPRWFRPAVDTHVYPNECSAEECPMWEFTGTYLDQPVRSAAPNDDCNGKDFSPWQYPELHAASSQ